MVDSWITPSFDLTGFATPLLFKFRMAYAQKDVNKTDYLKVYVSTNCGKTWNLRKSYSGSSMATTGVVASSFTPTSLSQWRLETINMNPYLNRTNIRIKFEFTSGTDNNLYIDDINLIGTPTGITEPTTASELNFEVYPNPASDLFNVAFELKAPGKTAVKVCDVLGREIKTIVNAELAGGIHEYNFDVHALSKGLYLISLTTGETVSIKKLIIE
jgi:hypothetical protein